MAFKNEERKSNIFSLRKVRDEEFEKLIDEIRTANVEGRTNIGRKTLVQLIEYFRLIWDENDTAWMAAWIDFINIATQIGCYGCENVTQARKDEVANYFQDSKDLKAGVKKRKDFFDFKELTDEAYQIMINVFLMASLEPLVSSYPNILFTYMICVACADTYNEKGIALIKKLRNEYFYHAPLVKKEGEAGLFQGTIK